MSEKQELRTTFDAGHRVWRIRLIMVMSLLWCAGFLWFAYESYHHYGLSPGDGGVLKPYTERLTLAIFLAVLAIVFPIGMHIYGLCYVAMIESSRSGHWHYYYTVSWFGTRCELVEEDDMGKQTIHKGTFEVPNIPGGPVVPKVDAPYKTQKTKQRRLPYILDSQA